MKIAIVEPPSDETPPNFTVPTILNCCTGPRAMTPMGWPMENPLLLAVEASMSISPGPLGQLPLVSVSGLKR